MNRVDRLGSIEPFLLSVLAVATALCAAEAQDVGRPRAVDAVQGPILEATGSLASLSEWSGVRAGIRLPDGTTVIADGGNARIVTLPVGGKSPAAAGRDGDGPGEYRRITSMVRCTTGDLGVFDGVHGRVTFLASDLAVRSTAQFPGTRNGRIYGCVGPDEVLLLLPRLAGPPAPGAGFDRRWELVRFLGGGTRETIVSGATEMYMASSRSTFVEVPLGGDDLLAVGGRAVYSCGNQDAKCVSRDLDSGAQATFNVQLPRPRVTGSAWQRVIDTYLSDPRLGPPDAVQTLRVVFGELTAPESFPAIRSIRADALGRLWVQPYSPGDSPDSQWIVAGRDGRILGTVILPVAVRPLDIGSDYILGLRVDQDGVEQVLVYRYPPLPQ